MKVLLLSDVHSVHSIKWANSLADKNIQVLICGFLKIKNPGFVKDNYNPLVQVVSIPYPDSINSSEGSFTKLLYLKAIPVIKKTIHKFQPDIVHAHYASSYGFLAALINFHPLIISMWGSDVISFPQTTLVHKQIFKFNLRRADRILSTSRFMAEKLTKYTSKRASITPFGVDTEKFSPAKSDLIKKEYDCVLGTIKSLEWFYGIEYLIKSFRIIKDSLPSKKLLLMIVGGGSLESKLKHQIKELDLEKDVLMTGRIPHYQAAEYHNSLDIFAALSVYPESFGVAVLEASSCGKPVVVTRIGGFPEVVDDNVTGFLVKPENAEDAAEKISRLILDPELRISMGKAGREKVIREFQWDESVEKMISIYKDVHL